MLQMQGDQEQRCEPYLLYGEYCCDAGNTADVVFLATAYNKSGCGVTISLFTILRLNVI
jgi:hypothetical protein